MSVILDFRPHPAFDLTDRLKKAILELARQPDIHSVSCPFDDFNLWEGLLQEQVRRSKEKGIPPQEAFYLSGPDSGIPGVTRSYGWDFREGDPVPPLLPDSRTGKLAPDCWGGEVHIPYEGACSGDLFILPEWHNAFPENLSRPNAKLKWLVGGTKACNYVLTNRNLGEFGCATLTHVAGCFLYKSTAPYEDCNPLHEPMLVEIAMKFAESFIGEAKPAEARRVIQCGLRHHATTLEQRAALQALLISISAQP